MTSFPGRIHYYLFPCLFLISLVVIEWLEILHLNNGVFSYTLDDPYIHLSLAKHIANGEYGFNHSEVSSPSSSVLWPFLLSLFSHLSFYEFMPLFLNSLFSLLILSVFILLCLSVDPKNSQIQWKHVFLFCILIPAINLVGLIFSGMEHSLQMLFSVLLISGLIRESRTQYFPRWLAVVIVIGPLIRYENLSLLLPALFFLFYRGHRKEVIYTSIGLLVLLSLFSIFLLYLGQPILPASILNKIGFAQYPSFREELFEQFNLNLTQRQGLIFLILLFIFTVVISFSKLTLIKKQLLSVVSISLLLHLFLGKFNWFHRYELYLYAAILLLIFYLYFDSYYQSKTPNTWYVLLLIGTFLAGYPYFTVLITLPQATNNVYLQQYQMRKFVINWVKSPVAVNDIGWVSFNNPYYVLDLWGLGSYDIYKKRSAHKNTLWMDKTIKKSHVKLVMLYKEWFYTVPSNWVSLGCLSFVGPRVSVADKTVNFYATDEKYVPELKQQLEFFKKELPAGDIFNPDCN
ncbi:hypothetical protein [Legionella cardiaca]|uniref:Glycosyltransferase RgtA/B/C/D-like domain-containing protein n=1 Tax=Legionella cardiaca TaxID=1071983 RepID=A0ABY8AUX2_9GAMM|nr:hypothetical protein [Legionella cardiaca]WED44463.1 hypothetical protein PXX05_06675 [Legionella cardiaca]